MLSDLRLWILLSLAVACSPARDTETARTTSDTAPAAPAPTAEAPRTGHSAIDDALSAAPASIASNATVMAWPDSAGGQPKELRSGTNSWTCFPSTPAAAGASGKDPMCLDKTFLTWADAWATRTRPKVERIGLAYMLQGDAGASNSDPFATAKTADNNWVQSGPHVMVVVPDVARLEDLSADPQSGGPWVMWKGTPYAHIMMPVR